MDYSTLTNQQAVAVKHGSGNIIVSASAGSGKTHVVITRIIRLITEENVSVNEILAVTFTNLAASEMKDKLKTAIINKINETGDTRLKKELDEVATSDISTIHSFCLNLLKKYFYAVELDATFEICDESKAKRLKAQAMDNIFERLYEEENEQFLYAVECFSRSRNDNALRNAVSDFAQFVESEASVDEFIKKVENTHINACEIVDKILTPYYQKRFNNILQKVEKIEPLFEGIEHRMVQISQLKQLIKDALNAKTFEELYNVVNVPKIERKNATDENSKILNPYYKKFDDYVKDITSCFSSGYEGLKLDANNSLKNINALAFTYGEYISEFNKLKREENVVDFSDLEHFTLKLLSNPDILKDVKSKYKYVFIDEYQDVNEVQERIICLISNSNAFMVGDSKQSIYAFRGCNPSHFLNKNKLYKSGLGTAVSLDKNFRSAKNIITTVNNVFSRVMTEDFGSHEYCQNQMVYGGNYGDYNGRAVIDVILSDVEKEKRPTPKGVYSVINDSNYKKAQVGSEEKLILKLINDAIGSDYYDVKENKYKKISYGDIVILMRSIGELGEKIVTALVNSGIPVSAETKNSIGEYPEIKSLVNFIKLITCARQDVPLANVLLEFFNFNEEELAIIRERGDEFSSFYDCTEKVCQTDSDYLSIKLQNFFDYLNKIRVICEFATAGEVLHRIISDTGYDAKIIASGLGEVKMRRIERFISASCEGGGNMSIREFSQNIEETLKDISVSEAAGDNTVKIMTMHASKGLEFPFVIIAGARKNFNVNDAAGFYLKDRELGIVTKTLNKDVKTISKNALHVAFGKKILEQSIIEEVRIFYVALTRAKCQLHVICDQSILEENQAYIGDVKKFSDLLVQTDAEIEVYKESELLSATIEEGVKVAGKEVSATLTSLIKRNLTLNYKYDKDTVLPVKSSVSELNTKSGEQEYYKTLTMFGDSDAQKGTAYHKALELINFYGDVNSQMQSLYEKGAFTEEEYTNISLEKLCKILEMDVFNKIKDYALYKEQKFCQLVTPSSIGLEYSDAQILVQGIIDLIAIKDGNAILIDYKLSKIQKDEDIVKKYKKQMQLYKLAIEGSLGVSVEKVYLVNILQLKCIQIEL